MADAAPAGARPLRFDLAEIARALSAAEGRRALDIGCGDGALMAALQRDFRVDVRGIEINPELVERCVARGLSVIQGDANRDLADYPDNSFDFVILAQTLQTTDRPDQVLDELLRVGSTAFVSFPNFAHWRTRAALLFKGRMPMTRALPVTWYETRNIHHVTIEDFVDLAKAKRARIERAWYFAGDAPISPLGANWRAEYAMFRLSR